MKNFKIFLSLVLTTILCASFSTTAFAAQKDAPVTKTTAAFDEETFAASQVSEVYVLNKDGSIMSLDSSISGYAHGTLTSNAAGLLVDVSASGVGGMGITVKTECNTTTTVTLIGGVAYPTTSVWTSSLNETITTNGNYEFHNLHHSGDFVMYLIGLEGIPQGVSVDTTVWIYG